MLTEKEKLDQLVLLGIELNKVSDIDLLMEKILTVARQFVNADAGSIYIREGDYLQFTYTQNNTLQERLPKDEKLIYSTFSIPIDEKSIAGFVAITGEALNIQDVYKIDPNASYKFSKIVDQKTGYKTKSTITIPLKTFTGDILGILQIINAKNIHNQVIHFSDDDEKIMLHFASIASIALERARMTRAIILRTIRMTQMHDPQETWGHVNRVGGYAVEIFEQWANIHNIPKDQIAKNKDILRIAAMLHDVGKIAISDLILKKPGRFNCDEYEIMKQHTVLGAQIFIGSHSEFDDIALQVALNHHERWDGTGYPGHVDIFTGDPLPEYRLPNGSAKGKKMEEIPLYGRIVAIADVYDALSSDRIYKKAWDDSKTLDTIHKGAGSQFDPELVQIFLSHIKMIKSIQDRYNENKPLLTGSLNLLQTLNDDVI